MPRGLGVFLAARLQLVVAVLGAMLMEIASFSYSKQLQLRACAFAVSVQAL